MSMNPWPLMLNAIVFASPVSLHSRAWSIAHATLYALSGGGGDPPGWMNSRARGEYVFLVRGVRNRVDVPEVPEERQDRRAGVVSEPVAADRLHLLLVAES